MDGRISKANNFREIKMKNIRLKIIIIFIFLILISANGCNIFWRLPDDYEKKPLEEKIKLFKEACKRGPWKENFFKIKIAIIENHGIDAVEEMLKIIKEPEGCKAEAIFIIGAILKKEKYIPKEYYEKIISILEDSRKELEYEYQREEAKRVIQWLKDEIKERFPDGKNN